MDVEFAVVTVVFSFLGVISVILCRLNYKVITASSGPSVMDQWSDCGYLSHLSV